MPIIYLNIIDMLYWREYLDSNQGPTDYLIGGYGRNRTYVRQINSLLPDL